MCVCCGLFAPTQFQFECCGVLDDSRKHILICKIFMRDLCKNMKPLWKVKDSFNRTSWKVSDVQIVRYTWVFSVSVSLCLCVSVSVCCVWLWWRRKRGEETNRTMSPSAVSLRIAETEQRYQAKRMIGGIGNMLLSTYSQTENG